MVKEQEKVDKQLTVVLHIILNYQKSYLQSNGLGDMELDR